METTTQQRTDVLLAYWKAYLDGTSRQAKASENTPEERHRITYRILHGILCMPHAFDHDAPGYDLVNDLFDGPRIAKFLDDMNRTFIANLTR